MSEKQDLTALQAAAAQAEAEAAEAAAQAAAARARAAKAVLEAAQKTSGSLSITASSEQVDKSTTKKSELEAGSSLPAQIDREFAQQLQQAYDFTGCTVQMGAALWQGKPVTDLPIRLPIGMLNRHALVAGATGTGKTRTLQLLAESLSAAGVPVFLTDVKSDLSGLASAAAASEKLLERTRAVGQDWVGQAFPVEPMILAKNNDGSDTAFSALPLRTTITDFGPLLLARALELNSTQSAALQLVFSWADSRGLELIDIKDLQAMVSFLTSEQGKSELKRIGGVSSATAGVILRSLGALQSQGGDTFFGEPEFDTFDLLRTDSQGRGVISLLSLRELDTQPALVSAFVMWLLADLFHDLPEVGDLDKPKLVFFFDEAHLLFKDASKEFLMQIVQVVKLIRSKGVGIVFVTQTPKDVPADILSQLGTRVQHALRAFTPEDAKALKATVSTFPNSPLDSAEILTTLGTGEALVTVLDPKGRPTPPVPTRLRAPAAHMGPLPPDQLAALVSSSTLAAKYRDSVDRQSAYEKLSVQKNQRQADEAQREQPSPVQRGNQDAKRDVSRNSGTATAGWGGPDLGKAVNGMFGSLMRSVGTQIGREITRSILGTARRRR